MTKTTATPPPRGDLPRLARGGLLSVGGGVTGAAGTMLLAILLTNGLGVDESGSVFRAIAAFNIGLAVVTLGTDATLVRFVASARHRGVAVSVRQLVVVAFVPVVAVAAVVGVVTAIVTAPPNSIMAVALPFGAVALAALGATRGFGTMLPTVVTERIGRPLLQLALVGAVVLADSSTAAAARAWSAGVAVSAAVAVTWLILQIRRQPGSEQSPGALGSAREFWRFAGTRALASVARTLVLWLDVVLVGVMVSSRAAALYTAATRLVQAGSVVVDGLGQAIEPMFATALAAGDVGRARPLYRTATSWMIVATWPLYWVLCVVPEPLLAVFGDGVRSAARVTAILAASALVGSGSGPVEVLLVMAGRSTQSLRITLVALAINVSLNLALIPWLGIEGAAIAWAASRVATNVLPLLLVRSELGIHPFSTGWWSAAALSTIVFGGGAAAARTVLGTRSAALPVALLAAGVLYAIALWTWRDRLQLGALVTNRSGVR